MKNPNQPVFMDDNEIIRFKSNPIVRKLIKESKSGLNGILGEDFSKDDIRQVLQLLGLSLDGYSEYIGVVSKKHMRKIDMIPINFTKKKMDRIKYCPDCGFELEPLNHLGDKRMWCEECGYKDLITKVNQNEEVDKMTSMKITTEVNIEPFDVPDLVKIKGKPGSKQNGFMLKDTIPLSELNNNILEKLCFDFRMSVFKKAQVDLPENEERPI